MGSVSRQSHVQHLSPGWNREPSRKHEPQQHYARSRREQGAVVYRLYFYNTRDKLPHCQQGAPGEKVICWPPPEVPQNMDTTIGNLGLTNEQEDQLVAFLKTLTDGYKQPSAYPQKVP